MNENEDEEDEILASVSYTKYRNDPDVLIDATMGEYNKECGDAMVQIIEALSKDSSIVHTINLVRDGLVASGHEELFIDILSKIGKIIIEQGKKLDGGDEERPCISPTDMM